MTALKKFLSQSQGSAMPMIIIFTALLIGFFLTGGLLSTRKHDPNEQGFTPSSQEAIVADKGKNMQIGALRFLFPTSEVNQPPTLTPTPTRANQSGPTPTITVFTPTPSQVPYCTKSISLPNFNPINTTNNACYCNEIVQCYFKTPKRICKDVIINGIMHPGVCSDSPTCLFKYTDGCPNGQCAYPPYISPQECTQYYQNGDCESIQCVAKPVIYLYPTKPMYVDVAVVTSGEIVVSDPLYPSGGWKNVFAKPNGDLLYNNIPYKELFYETEVKDIKAPENGIVIERKDLKKELTSILTQLGLIENEREEFLYFWLPRLYKTNAPYIVFSLIDPEEKHRIDYITVNPKPQTMIEIVAYFKPLQEKTALPELILPTSIPERRGFTVVEWGGALDD